MIKVWLGLVLFWGGLGLTMENTEKPTPFFSHALDTLDGLEVQARKAEVVARPEGAALLLDGMVLVPDLKVSDARIEVEILTKASCYPGLAFRIQDSKNFELAYIVPHVSGQGDAIQYDSLFCLPKASQSKIKFRVKVKRF